MIYLPELPGLMWSRLMCRALDRHNVYCRGRIDHTREQRSRTR